LIDAISEATPSVDAVIAAVARRRDPVVLDSADPDPARGRYTIVVCDPVEVACWHRGDGDPFEGMRGRLRQTLMPEFPCSDRPPWRPRNSRQEQTAATGGGRYDSGFLGGWIGYFAYEAARYIERLPASTTPDIPLPLARFALYDTAAIHDAVTGRWRLIAVELPESAGVGLRPRGADRLAEWETRLRSADAVDYPPPPPRTAATDNMTRPAYLQMVRRAKEYIAAGDIFQVNLARRESFPIREPIVNTYLRLRRTNPSAYGAFISWNNSDPSRNGYDPSCDRQGAVRGQLQPPLPDGRGSECAILSASPELFLQLKDGHVVTRPIKGTRPRSNDPIVDAAHQADLLASAKDQAELAMIVDLERNDLGRVCEFGSIRVAGAADPMSGGTHKSVFVRAGARRAPTKTDLSVPPLPDYPFELETHPTVHHLVATVTGRLHPARDAIDLVRACFPGGSITGAPKVRAMEIIDELEPTSRSVYTGAIGYFGLDGSMMFNIAIRTMIAADGQIHLHAGGGIVADSVPEDEYEETQAKALGMRRALGLFAGARILSRTQAGDKPFPRDGNPASKGAR